VARSYLLAAFWAVERGSLIGPPWSAQRAAPADRTAFETWASRNPRRRKKLAKVDKLAVSRIHADVQRWAWGRAHGVRNGRLGFDGELGGSQRTKRLTRSPSRPQNSQVLCAGRDGRAGTISAMTRGAGKRGWCRTLATTELTAHQGRARRGDTRALRSRPPLREADRSALLKPFARSHRPSSIDSTQGYGGGAEARQPPRTTLDRHSAEQPRCSGTQVKQIVTPVIPSGSWPSINAPDSCATSSGLRSSRRAERTHRWARQSVKSGFQ
jgi:hypothetical protein